MATFQEKILNLVERYGYTGLGKQVGHTPDRIHRWADTEKGAGEPDAATALCFARLCGRRDQSFWLAFAAERTNLTLLRESLEIEEGSTASSRAESADVSIYRDLAELLSRDDAPASEARDAIESLLVAARARRALKGT